MSVEYTHTKLLTLCLVDLTKINAILANDTEVDFFQMLLDLQCLPNHHSLMHGTQN